jgi:hypothetical protein
MLGLRSVPQRGSNNPAQGNALGKVPKIAQALKGRQNDAGVVGAWGNSFESGSKFRGLSRPFRADDVVGPSTQGVALGCIIVPLWGRDACIGLESIPHIPFVVSCGFSLNQFIFHLVESREVISTLAAYCTKILNPGFGGDLRMIPQPRAGEGRRGESRV